MNYPDSDELRGKIGMEAAKIMKKEQDKLIKKAEELKIKNKHGKTSIHKTSPR